MHISFSFGVAQQNMTLLCHSLPGSWLLRFCHRERRSRLVARKVCLKIHVTGVHLCVKRIHRHATTNHQSESQIDSRHLICHSKIFSCYPWLHKGAAEQLIHIHLARVHQCPANMLASPRWLWKPQNFKIDSNIIQLISVMIYSITLYISIIREQVSGLYHVHTTPIAHII